MIQLRQDQLDAFQTAAGSNAEQAIVERIIESFPKAEAWHGRRALANLVRDGIEKAGKHGLKEREDVLRYIGAALLLGADFENDPQLPWAQAAMSGSGAASAAQRVGALWTGVLDYRNRVIGPDDQFFRAAVRSISGKQLETLVKNASRSQRELFLQLAAFYPQKTREVGEAMLTPLTRAAVAACEPHELLDRWAVALVVQLMFLFGAGIFSDPLTSWVGEALARSKGANIDDRLQVLLDAAGAYADRLVST